MKQKGYTALELVTVIENTIEDKFNCEVVNSVISTKLDKTVYVSKFKNFIVHTIVFKNGVVKYNLLGNKSKFYTLTYKQLISEISNIFTKL